MASKWTRIFTNPAVRKEVEQLPHTLSRNIRMIDILSKKVEHGSKFTGAIAFCTVANSMYIFVHCFNHKHNK